MPSLSRPTSAIPRMRAAWAISMSDLGCLCCSFMAVLCLLFLSRNWRACGRAAQDAALRHDRAHGYIMRLRIDCSQIRELISDADGEGLGGKACQGPIIISAAISQPGAHLVEADQPNQQRGWGDG